MGKTEITTSHLEEEKGVSKKGTCERIIKDKIGDL